MPILSHPAPSFLSVLGEDIGLLCSVSWWKIQVYFAMCPGERYRFTLLSVLVKDIGLLCSVSWWKIYVYFAQCPGGRYRFTLLSVRVGRKKTHPKIPKKNHLKKNTKKWVLLGFFWFFWFLQGKFHILYLLKKSYFLLFLDTNTLTLALVMLIYQCIFIFFWKSRHLNLICSVQL